MFDPTPEAIRKGRPHFYNTIRNSGLGQAACASCHLDGRMDRLAWDLGSQLLPIKPIRPQHNFGNNVPSEVHNFHPMKGPMVTQTLQDIIGHEPFHWRGDRDGLEEFNPTFTELQGADQELTEVEMQEFEDFLASLTLPPNRFRNFDNSLPTAVQLSNHFSLGRHRLAKGEQLPVGDARRGLDVFRAPGVNNCTQCHTLPTGMGPDRVFVAPSWREIPAGPNGERHLSLSAVERSEGTPFKIAQLRNLSERIGFDSRSSSSRAGFGFLHDGRVDTLTRFIQDGFTIFDDQQTADLIAFLLAFSGSDLPAGSPQDINNAPGVSSRDTPAATGRQALVSSSNQDVFSLLLSRASSANGRVDLVIKALDGERERGWYFDRARNSFLSDTGETWSTPQLRGVTGVTPLLLTLVPTGLGPRIGIDRDQDGVFDALDSPLGAGPVAPASMPKPLLINLIDVGATASGEFRFSWLSKAGERYRIASRQSWVNDRWQEEGLEVIAQGSLTTVTIPFNTTAAEQYFRVERIQ